MAVTAKTTDLGMKIRQATTDAEGEAVTKIKSFSGVNTAATDDQIYTAGHAIGTLYPETLDAVIKVTTAELVSE